MPSIKVITQEGMPILRMLLLEEALLRSSRALQHNWCFINDGSAIRSIVLGISGKTHQLVHEPAARAAGVQVVKRFSGGGTVVVDGDTQFVTLIINQPDLAGVPAQPRTIMQWTEEFYAPLFSPFGSFHLREQDYCYGMSKFGGNAQAITKNRWLHHTSFLWDFDATSMQLLQMPAKAPAYRAGRDHLEFICKLKNKLPSRGSLLQYMRPALRRAGFRTQETSLEEAEDLLKDPYLSTTKVIDLG